MTNRRIEVIFEQIVMLQRQTKSLFDRIDTLDRVSAELRCEAAENQSRLLAAQRQLEAAIRADSARKLLGKAAIAGALRRAV